MRGLVRDNVRGQAGVDIVARLSGFASGVGVEIAETQGLIAARIEGIAVKEGVRRDFDMVRVGIEGPADMAPQCGLELRKRGRNVPVSVLSVKIAVFDQLLDVGDIRVAVFVAIALARRVIGVLGGVEVDDVDAMALGAGRQGFLRHRNGDRERLPILLNGRILGENCQLANGKSAGEIHI